MNIAILTFDGFNEIDSFVTSHILSRVDLPGWNVRTTGPATTVTSMNGVVIETQERLGFARRADAVVIGSGMKTREIVKDLSITNQLDLDPGRQLIASQCSGALLLMELGLVKNVPICTDRKTQVWAEEAGYEVLNQPIHAKGRVATVGGCLASHYLSAWLIWSLASEQAAIDALQYVLPHGEEDEYTSRALRHVEPYVVGLGKNEDFPIMREGERSV
jgi:transcriptional regulator GlxA family with amidase domain